LRRPDEDGVKQGYVDRKGIFAVFFECHSGPKYIKYGTNFDGVLGPHLALEVDIPDSSCQLGQGWPPTMRHYKLRNDYKLYFINLISSQNQQTFAQCGLNPGLYFLGIQSV
jgi:hypothetical protein